MKRSILCCLIFTGALFFVEFDMDLAVQTDSSLSLFTNVVHAQDGEEEEVEPEDPRPERKLLNPSQEWFLQREKITAAIAEKDYARARELLDKQVERTRRWNDRELAIFHQTYLELALIMEDYELILEQANKILEFADQISYPVEEITLWRIATVYASDQYPGKDYEIALEYIQRWLDLTNDWKEGSRNYAYIAGIYTNKEDFFKTEEWMLRAIDKAEEEGVEVQEYWWVQLWQAYIQLSEQLGEDRPVERDSYLQKALSLSQFLVYNYIEKKEYWTRLSSVYAKIEELSENVADEAGGQWGYTLEAAYHFGLLTNQNEIKRVIASMRSKSAGSRAIRVYEDSFDQELLERNFDNLNRFGQTLYGSTEVDKAAKAYEEAVSFKDDATVLHSLASLHQLNDDFEKCITFADRALNATEGELRSPEQVKFLKGVCQFYNDDLDGSESTMEELRDDIGENSDDTRLNSLRESAGQYIELIDSERARIDWKEYVAEQWRQYNASKQS